jgi:2-hydroxy-6-oxonona-2,4-dienedioate hydrolase
MEHQIKQEGEFKYLEVGQGDTIMLLHGLMGALSNFQDLIAHFSKRYHIVVPILPILELPIREATIDGLLLYLHKFVQFKQYQKFHILGNSLGGHVALLYALSPEGSKHLASLILTGSSGLFENALSNSFPKRGNYEYIKAKTEAVFYDPNIVTPELVDEVFEIVNNRDNAIRIIATAKSAIRHNVGEQLHQLNLPTLLIWGAHDMVTPPFVGEEFNRLIKNSQLHIIDQCGHAPMMEVPQKFNTLLEQFLQKIPQPT